MSTVLLMTDAWQPTVLRIVPFSSNNARSLEKAVSARGHNGKRGFPVLAVTRSASQKSSSANSNSESRSGDGGSISVASQPNCEASIECDAPVEESDAVSVFSNASAAMTEKTNAPRENSPTKQHRKYAKKKVPDVHSEMKEAIKFSVQDINDQISSSASLTSADNKDNTKDKRHSRVDNTRTKLPKPSLSTSPETRMFYSPINGVRRSVPLTPGEIELQRVRDNNFIDHVQNRKKYKLNVNQLPRSTTPITDHDPDKLNMKQVIAFLQTKPAADVNVKKSKNVCIHTPRGFQPKNLETDLFPSPSPKKLFVKDNVRSISRANSEMRYTENENSAKSRQAAGRLSRMSAKSTPNMPCHMKSGKATSVRSDRSYTSKDKKSDRKRPMKEFKLYRFLAVHPDEQAQSVVSSGVSEPAHVVEKSIVTEEFRSSEPPRKVGQFLRNKEREHGTTRVLHRHVIRRVSVTPPKVDTSKDLHLEETTSKTIRLPLMDDTRHNTHDIDSDADSDATTSATCNSTQNSSVSNDRLKEAKKAKSITFDESNTGEFGVNITIKKIDAGINSVTSKPNPYSDQVDQQNDDFPLRTHKLPTFPKVNISVPKHITVNVPQQPSALFQSQEIVRLTLRQEKNTTRVTSYMSDMQAPPIRWLEHESSYTKENSSTKSNMAHSMPHGVPINNHHTDCVDSARQHLSSITNNNFIKVRQKLKSTPSTNNMFASSAE